MLPTWNHCNVLLHHTTTLDWVSTHLQRDSTSMGIFWSSLMRRMAIILRYVKVKVKVNVYCREHTSKALR